MTQSIEPTIGEVWGVVQMAGCAMEKIGEAIGGLTDRVLRMDSQLNELLAKPVATDYDQAIEEEKRSRDMLFSSLKSDIDEFEPEMQKIMHLGAERLLVVIERGGYQIASSSGMIVYDGETSGDISEDWDRYINS